MIRRICSLSCLLLVLLAPAACATAAADSGGGGASSNADEQHRDFEIYQALANTAIAVDARDAALAARSNIYLGEAGLSRGLIQAASITVDGGAAQAIDLSQAAAKVMQEGGGLRRIARLTLAPGSHAIDMEFIVANPAKPADQPARLTGEARFKTNTGTVDLEFEIDHSLIGGGKIEITQLQRDDGPPRSGFGVHLDQITPAAFATVRHYRSGSDADPALSYAKSLDQAGERGAALAELLAMRPTAAAEMLLATDYWLEEMHVSCGLGMLDWAARIGDRLDLLGERAADVATERLHLADAYNSAGQYDLAEKQLKQADRALPDLFRPEWRYIYGRVLLAQQRPGDAVAVIGKIDQTAEAYDFIFTSADAVRSAAYNRFNLAVAMVRSGEERRGLSWLDLIGRSMSRDPQMLDLRDKANLALGWQFLREKQGRTALGVLGRVRSEGLQSNSALLGMGWSELAPNGARLPLDVLDSPSTNSSSGLPPLTAPMQNSLIRLHVLEPELNGGLGPGSFKRDDPPKDRKEGLRRALKVWSVLLNRDPRDASVQEAMLATAYAYDQLGEAARARSAYDTALAALDQVKSGIEGSRAFIANGELSAALPAAMDQAAQFKLMDRLHLPPDETSAQLYVALDRARELGGLQAALADAARRLGAAADSPAAPAGDGGSTESELADRLHALMASVTQQQAENDKAVEALAMNGLAAQADVLSNYLKVALLAKARIEDQPDLVRREPREKGDQGQ